MTKQNFDFAVVGAGCFGAWTARALLDAGHSVALIDAFGSAHSRASSGGESRVIRMGYGADELYTRWSMRSLMAWKALNARCKQKIFHETGMLWLTGGDDNYLSATQKTLERVGVAHEKLSPRDLEEKFPQISSADIAWGLCEPASGVLMARRSVQSLVSESVERGVSFRIGDVLPVSPQRANHLRLRDGSGLSAGTYVFACGPWLPKLFPELLGSRIFPTRQEVFFFAPPPGDISFAPPAMPAWFHHPALVYGMPDLENRGFKVSVDKHGAAFDPDTGSRVFTAEALAMARAYIEERFPKLKNAALTESRVCQYENTSNGDFIIDRHPELDNVVIVGGGSGHGFKHGPAVGEYVCAMLTQSNAAFESRFALATKATAQARSVY
ncbi:MAG TPA: FAD-dependent oxidoreductase [Rudaea sp.]|nr:FAD-dependent oxidoreductase [Rudaea sp.]